MRARVPVRRLGHLGDGAGCIRRRGVGAALRPVLLPRRVRAVEVALQVFDREDRVLGRRAGAPGRIAVAPVRERDVARRGGDGAGHGVEQDAVGVELDGVGGPVETVLVEAFGGGEVQLVDLEGVGVRGVEACLGGFRGLEDEVDGLGGGVEFDGEKFHVDLLRVIQILR